jgi:hypothetical protein
MVLSPAGLRWRGPAATVNYRPVLPSEWALQNNKPSTAWKKISRRKRNWSRVPDGRLTAIRTGRLTVGSNLTSTSTHEVTVNSTDLQQLRKSFLMVLVQHAVGGVQLLHVCVVGVEIARQGSGSGGHQIRQIRVLVVLSALQWNTHGVFHFR